MDDSFSFKHFQLDCGIQILDFGMPLTFKNIIIPTAILLDSQFLMGQQPTTPLVESTESDSKYANTTVVFKQKDADDALVLLSLGQGYSTGGVVRIAVADPVPQPVEVKTPARPQEQMAVSDEITIVTAAKPTEQSDFTTEIWVKPSPKPSAANEKSLAEKRANGLRSPQPIPVKTTGKMYDPNKKGVFDKFPKIHLPHLNLGNRVTCPKF